VFQNIVTIFFNNGDIKKKARSDRLLDYVFYFQIKCPGTRNFIASEAFETAGNWRSSMFV
jgi:hypothetical protein